MNLTKQDWNKLRFPILFFGLSIIAATVVVGYAEKRRDTLQKTMVQQESQLNQARQRYQASGQEKEIISQYLPLYQRLIHDGFIGEERRLEWVDGLRTIHQQHKLFGINYNIETQQEFKPSFALNVGPFSLQRSVMKLELAMLHEGDLLTLINALDTQQSTPFIVRECEITRTGATNTNNLAPNLKADCELDWLTIREPQMVKQ